MEILCEINKLVSQKLSQNGIISLLLVNNKAWSICFSKFIIILNKITIIILNENVTDEVKFVKSVVPEVGSDAPM